MFITLFWFVLSIWPSSISLMLLPLLTVFDFSTVRANFIKPVNLSKVKARSLDFALLVPIFNDTKYLTNIAFMKRYADRVVLCTTTNETPEFMQSLENLSKEYGFRIHACEVGDGKKNPWAIYNKTLLAHDAVLKSSIGRLKEKYVIFIDGDTWVDGELEVLAGAMEEKQYDISSVKVLPGKRQTPMEHLQGVEYDIAMQARLLYPWLTSGAGMIAKREVMIAIMRNHSLFFNGGDVEIGKLADMMGYKVGHLPMVFYTDVPSTFKAWAKQRFSWMCGMFRHSIINVDHNLKHPFHFIYFTFIIYFLMPFKVIDMISHPQTIPLILSIYVLITYFANWKVRSKWMLIFPFYALFQVLVLVWCGIYRYFQTVKRSQNIGKIKMTYNPNNLNLNQFSHLSKTAKNYATVSLIVFLISATNLSFFQRFVFGQSYEPLELAYAVADRIYEGVQSAGDDLQIIASEKWGEEVFQGQVAGAYDEKAEE